MGGAGRGGVPARAVHRGQSGHPAPGRRADSRPSGLADLRGARRRGAVRPARRLPGGAGGRVLGVFVRFALERYRASALYDADSPRHERACEQLRAGVRARRPPPGSRTSCRRPAIARRSPGSSAGPTWPAPALVLHGPPGCGKSHLARIWAARVGARRLDPAALPPCGDRAAACRGARSGRADRRRGGAAAALQPPARAGRASAADRAPAGRRPGRSACRISPRACAPRPRSRSARPTTPCWQRCWSSCSPTASSPSSDGVIGYLVAPHGALLRRRPGAWSRRSTGTRCASGARSPWRSRARCSRPQDPTANRRRKAMDLGIAGKKALVCAASKGLGRGCALALAQQRRRGHDHRAHRGPLEAGRARDRAPRPAPR